MGFLFFRALALSFPWPRLRLGVLAALLSALYGVSDEFHQSFIPGRFATVEDVVADSLGACFGVILALFFYMRGERGVWRFRFRS
jgi:VanZ family protein